MSSSQKCFNKGFTPQQLKVKWRGVFQVLQLVSFYREDLSIDIVGEVQQFQNYTHSKYRGKKTDFTHAELCDIIVQDQICSVFPNLHVDIAFRISLLSCWQMFRLRIVFAAQENQEPVQNNDGSGEIGLSVSTVHWGRNASLSWLWWRDQRFCIRKVKEKDFLNCTLHCNCKCTVYKIRTGLVSV